MNLLTARNCKGNDDMFHNDYDDRNNYFRVEYLIVISDTSFTISSCQEIHFIVISDTSFSDLQ